MNQTYLSLRFLVIVVYLLVDFVNLEKQWVKLHGAGKTPMSKMSLNCSLQRSKLKFLVRNSSNQTDDHRVIAVMVDIWVYNCGVFGPQLVQKVLFDLEKIADSFCWTLNKTKTKIKINLSKEEMSKFALLITKDPSVMETWKIRQNISVHLQKPNHLFINLW